MFDIKSKKIALVHDYLLNIGGAERVLKVLHEMFPRAHIYTVVYDKKFVNEFFAKKQGQAPLRAGPGPAFVRGSFLQKLPLFLRKRYKYFSFLIPAAVESLDLSEYDIVISSSSAFSKGVITRPDTVHICYCHTPTRFLWDWTHEYYKDLAKKGYKVMFARVLMHFLRTWDRQAASRVDYFIANSKHVAARIKKYYGRDAKVIYPPVLKERRYLFEETQSRRPASGELFGSRPPHTNPSDGTGQALLQKPVFPVGSLALLRGSASDTLFSSNTPVPSSFYLVVSQLRPYKQIDVAVDAFKKVGFPLVIIGDGDDKKRLQELASGYKNIIFLGRQPDEVVSRYYANCKAFIFPGEEDFGMTMVEAMAHGKPVLALRVGGAKEIIIEGVTGEFFNEAHPMVLADGLRRLNENYASYSNIVIKKRAEKFSREQFERELYDFIEKCFRM